MPIITRYNKNFIVSITVYTIMLILCLYDRVHVIGTYNRFSRFWTNQFGVDGYRTLVNLGIFCGPPADGHV